MAGEVSTPAHVPKSEAFGRDDLQRMIEDHHRVVEPAALELIMSASSPLDLTRAILGDPQADGAITRLMVDRYLPHPGSLLDTGRFELIRDGFQTGTRKSAPQEAYHDLFTDRYTRLRRILHGSSALKNIVSLGELRRHAGEEASVVGMITGVRFTEKARHLLLTLDDPTGQGLVMVPKDSDMAKDTYLNDEVIGVRVWLPKDGGPAIAKEVARPEVPLYRDTRKSEGPSNVLFLSDLHVGSRMFLKESWGALSSFLHGEAGHEELVRRIRHVVVAGDLVDGIGIYPGQERDLSITDIVEQYRELGRLLAEFPRDLNVVVIPGNHDAVCPAEPQPSLSPIFASLLPPNVRTAGNPSLFALDGVLVEAYHGRSFDNIIPAIPGARYENATEVMKRMLAMRHLSPSFGEKLPLAPLPRDGLIIDPVPDIFVTGHTHTSGVERYRGVTLINASAWISETDYQKMRNVRPDPAKGFVMDLTKHSVTQVDFTVEP